MYSKRRSLQEEGEGERGRPREASSPEPEDLFTAQEEQDRGVGPRPPLVPETAWNTLRQVAPPLPPEAETSFNERRSDEYGSIRFDTVKQFIPEVHIS